MRGSVPRRRRLPPHALPRARTTFSPERRRSVELAPAHANGSSRPSGAQGADDRSGVGDQRRAFARRAVRSGRTVGGGGGEDRAGLRSRRDDPSELGGVRPYVDLAARGEGALARRRDTFARDPTPRATSFVRPGGRTLPCIVPTVPGLRSSERGPSLRDVPAGSRFCPRVPRGDPVRSPLADPADRAGARYEQTRALGLVREPCERRAHRRAGAPDPCAVRPPSVPVHPLAPPLAAVHRSPSRSARARAPLAVRVEEGVRPRAAEGRHRKPNAARGDRTGRAVPLLQRHLGRGKRYTTPPAREDRRPAGGRPPFATGPPRSFRFCAGPPRRGRRGARPSGPSPTPGSLPRARAWAVRARVGGRGRARRTNRASVGANAATQRHLRSRPAGGRSPIRHANAGDLGSGPRHGDEGEPPGEVPSCFGPRPPAAEPACDVPTEPLGRARSVGPRLSAFDIGSGPSQPSYRPAVKR